ncbi:MAG: M16 family metallopeptidase [Planctomycetota bacterium]|jgi:predicted Zn-dependent peptidase
MTEGLDKRLLDNGMVILGEPMESVESAAFGFLLPAGASVLSKECCGGANIIEDWIFRGAGRRNSRALSDALEGLGLHRSSSVSSSHIAIGGALEASNLPAALGLYADIILRASLEDSQFEPARQLAIDQVKSLDDDPRHKVLLKLREQFYPSPLGISTMGQIEELETLTAQKTRQLLTEHFNLSESIFAVAGKYDFDAVLQQLKALFETNEKKESKSVSVGEKCERYTHIHNDGAQVHIGLMTETVKPCDKDYYNARVAISVLSGGMSARLFTEVREKRGLCYAIGAKYHCLKQQAGIMCYAGTTPDKAQETVNVITAEFNKLKEGISAEEIQRAQVGLKSVLILQSESSSSRAGSIAGDYYMLGRVRSLDEIKEKVDETTVDSVQKFLKENEFKDFTVVTIGPREVKV